MCDNTDIDSITETPTEQIWQKIAQTRCFETMDISETESNAIVDPSNGAWLRRNGTIFKTTPIFYNCVWVSKPIIILYQNLFALA